MRLLRALLLTLMLVSLVGLALQSNLRPSDVHYKTAFVSERDATAVYISSMASVKLYAVGTGEFWIEDLQTGETIFTGEVEGNGAFSLVFPHPGYYEFGGNSRGGITITITPVDVGFPGKQKSAHLWVSALFGGLLALTLLGGGRR
ncbi:hypothetical protein FH039_06685 [Thermococcus indicus]|uniref:Uncharacterized protein n=1 Tax=Thermococcus indicus TaxID=2586643 RepID=A0A4Y5SKB7_9EURY|nr:hypothetical protein [Thermococcus indicus]QDA31348.1 hypothetical protein FH039_06685 [Thermococcus indicus]